jgi:formylglycine-generating enzyme required for sulfatase activity
VLRKAEDELVRVADTALRRLGAALAIAPPGDEVAERARVHAQRVLHVLRHRARRRGERTLAESYGRDLRRIAQVGEPPPSRPASLSLETTVPDAHVRVMRFEADVLVTALEASLPMKGRALPPGRSFVAEITAPGHIAVRVPFVAEDEDEVDLGRVVLPRATELLAPLAERFAYVAPGPFLAGDDPEDQAEAVRPRSPTFEPVWVKGFFIARHEVTVGEYTAFLNDLPPPERAHHLPSPSIVAARPDSDGAFRYEPARRGSGEDCARLPVFGVRDESALAYAAWRTKKAEGKVRFRLPTSDEWEKAARGTDGRTFPWGNVFDEKAACLAAGESLSPTKVGSHPLDVSPYGVFDMAGNVSEWTSDTFAPGFRIVRGGSYVAGPEVTQLASREPMDAALFHAQRHRIGFRLAFDEPEG